ncbi:UNVERIFIED_CONTAM: hypothetical protein HDU68_004115 [Siphonaria sp. JEL0065]|nr:hypothetical protein HDU68_004115 [Siphonaria sp. JEL0065]
MVVLTSAPPCFAECVNSVMDGDSTMIGICRIASEPGAGRNFVECVQECNATQALTIGGILVEQNIVLAKSCNNMGVIMKNAPVFVGTTSDGIASTTGFFMSRWGRKRRGGRDGTDDGVNRDDGSWFGVGSGGVAFVVLAGSLLFSL